MKHFQKESNENLLSIEINTNDMDGFNGTISVTGTSPSTF